MSSLDVEGVIFASCCNLKEGPGKAVQENRFSLRPDIPGKLKSHLKSELHLISTISISFI